jgi:hypothetical protein
MPYQGLTTYGVPAESAGRNFWAAGDFRTPRRRGARGHISLAQFFERKENPTVEATAENKNDYTIV